MHELYFFSNLRVAITQANFSERKITKEINIIYNNVRTTILYNTRLRGCIYCLCFLSVMGCLDIIIQRAFVM